jgi:hypothetical protein
MLTFTSEAFAIAAREKVWANYVRKIAAEGDGRVGLENTPYTSAQVEALSDSEVKNLKVYGFRSSAEKDVANGLTESWDIYLKVYDQNLWFMSEPPAELMTGVENYSIQALNPEWFDPNLNP